MATEHEDYIKQVAAATSKKNDSSGGKTRINLGFTEFPPPPPLPPTLSEQEQQEYLAAYDAITNMTFDTGYRKGSQNEAAIRDAVEYQAKAVDALNDAFKTIGDPSASQQDKATARLTVGRISTKNLGDIKAKGSPLAEFREKGDSFFEGTNIVKGASGDDRAAALWSAPAELDSGDYTVGKQMMNLASMAKQARNNLDYADTPQARAEQIAQTGPRAAIDYNNNAPQGQAAQIADVPQLGDLNYRNPIERAGVAQIQDVGSIQKPGYMPIVSGTEAQISPDAMIDDAAVQMAESRWQDPAYFNNIDSRGFEAMEGSLDYYGDLIANDGRDAVSEAYFNAKRREAETNRRGNLQAALQDLDARGMGRSGGEFQAAIQGANESMRSQFDAAMQAAAIAQQRKDDAAAQQAMIGEAHRKMQFGEAATMEEALRQVSMAKAELEMNRQVVNADTLRQQAAMDQQMRLANLDVMASEYAARNRFGENAELTEYQTAADRYMEQARMQNNANLANAGFANTEYGARNRAMEQGNLQTQSLGAQRNIAQGGLENQMNITNTGIQGDDWNARNRALEDFSKQDMDIASQRAIEQARLGTQTNVANTGFRASEIGAQNRYREAGLNDDYARLAGAIQGDAQTRYTVDAGNLGRVGGNIGNYVAQGNYGDQYALDLARLKMQQDAMPPAWTQTLGAIGGVLQGGGNTAANLYTAGKK